MLLLLMAVLSGCQETKKSVTQYTIDQFYENIILIPANFSSDETKLLMTSNESGIFNAYEIDVKSGEKTQLTQSTKESYWAESYFPIDDHFIFRFDEGGNENHKIIMQRQDGSTMDLTPGDSIRNLFFNWSRDGGSLYYESNKRTPEFMDLYKVPIASLEAKELNAELLYANNDGLDIMAISHNERYLVLIENITLENFNMFLFDRENGEAALISEHVGNATYEPQFFSLDDKTLYYLTDENSDYLYLARRDIETGKVERIFETNWDLMYALSSWNERYRVIGINEDAKTVVKVFNNETGDEVVLPIIEGGSITSVSISKSEKLACLTVSSSASPSNLYIYNFETGTLKKITDTLNPDIDPNDLVEGKVVRYKSFDGLEIPAIYYQPKTTTESEKAPGLVWVHGGPGGQSRLSFFPLIQYLVNHGYAILAVNNRGSSGYGKKFYLMDNQNHGDRDLKDCIAGKDFFESTKVVDMDRIGIIGGSYGGYMVMAALTFEPEAFNVGVNIFGVTNWLRTLKSMPPHWESVRKALYDELGDPYTEDSVRLYNISPLFHTQNVTKPLMVLQGANDVRVLQVESDEIVEKVRANGVPVDYIIFDDEGHGFRKKENEIEGYGQIGEFLDKYLKNKQ